MNLGLRIDKYLWYIRQYRSRSQAQAAIGKGQIRMNGDRIIKSHAEVHIGDIITMPRGTDVIAIKIISIPQRRGPAAEAHGCYKRL